MDASHEQGLVAHLRNIEITLEEGVVAAQDKFVTSAPKLQTDVVEWKPLLLQSMQAGKYSL